MRCSDEDVYRHRLGGRRRRIEGFPEPSWSSVEKRRRSFEEWSDTRLGLDSITSRATNLQTAMAWLSAETPIELNAQST
ncbi:MAG: hypothetical protein ABJA87_05445 [bacterium]